ncbi:MAG TPA: hypothetical protein PKD58_01600 [Candidatus Sumerlaeota bacterium]|nr:hypothetical protein [Candidatus Sumerlaeota bacterium]HMZ52881.1 hypothetical protein [Candidatus Sumerlaeota bacterium]HNM46674.1 hypothetical protein [Candidatus Sumerlaeota bacterium]
MKSLQNMPREEAFMVILRALHQRWRLAVAIPLLYMIAGVLVQAYLFKHNGGLMEVSRTLLLVMIFLGGAFSVLLWHLLTALFRRQQASLAEAAGSIDSFAGAAFRQQKIQFITCDLAALPGIVIFLCTGDLFHLVMFIVISMFFYLRCFPSGRKLGEPLFLRDE